MSTGFTLRNEVYWGTSGAIELCLTTMLTLIDPAPETSSPLATFLRTESQHLFPGKVISFAPVTRTPEERQHLAVTLERTIEALLESQELTDVGRRWVADTLPAFRDEILIVR
jgi:hypothetical protein